jgi:hypothetical protein
VTLTYEYGRSLVWLDDLLAERDPHAYDMCRRHAARLSVPLGWRLFTRSGQDPTGVRLGAYGGSEVRAAG